MGIFPLKLFRYCIIFSFKNALLWKKLVIWAGSLNHRRLTVVNIILEFVVEINGQSGWISLESFNLPVVGKGHITWLSHVYWLRKISPTGPGGWQSPKDHRSVWDTSILEPACTGLCGQFVKFSRISEMVTNSDIIKS